jgi:predicted transcriptional regulator
VLQIWPYLLSPIDKNTGRLTRNAPLEIEIDIHTLGISKPHLVRPIIDEHVAFLVDTDENEWEPIEVRAWPDEWEKPSQHVQWHVVSGNHRTSAARIKGLETVGARIIEASDERSYLHAAIKTNARHGRNFTEDDRKILAGKLKALGESSSDIAKLFGVHKSTVNNWLSNRDTNASKKNNAREQAQNVLADLGIEDLSDDWKYVPTVTADAKQIAKVGQSINDFLAETPLSQDKAYIVAWVRLQSKLTRQSLAQDMLETIQWLTNVTTLLRSEA